MATMRKLLAHGQTLFVVLTLVIAIGPSAIPQDRQRDQPNLRFPPPCRPVLPRLPAPVESGHPAPLVDVLRGILIVDGDASVIDPIAAFDGIRIDPAADVTIALQENFLHVLKPHLGKPISMQRLNQMAQNIVAFYRQHGQPVVDVSLPPGQDITDGIVQVAIRESSVGRVCVHGNCWFDTGLLRRQSHFCSGQRITECRLRQELRWLNGNPFRDVGVSFQPGVKPGTTDLIYHVQDQRPVRTYVGYSDDGTRITGLERLQTGFVWGNAFGNDHMLSYQFSADAPLSGRHDVHSFEYRVPFASTRDTVSLYGSWGRTDTRFDIGGVTTSRTGDAWQLSLRYLHTLHESFCQTDRLHFGLDFKGADNFAEFGIPSLSETTGSSVHIAQLNVGWTSRQQFYDGQTSYGVDIFASPGGLMTDNHARDFKQVRNHTRATYAYARGHVEELYNLNPRSDLVFRLTGQLSTSRLLPTEQLGLGGYQSIRGYDMRSINGDNGYILNAEYRTRPVVACHNGHQSSLTLLMFGDVGQHFNWGNNAMLPFDDGDLLASVGVGMRYTLNPGVNVRFDYGLPLTDIGGVRRNTSGRVHVGASVSF